MLLSLSLSCACFVFVKSSLYLNTLWAWHACFVPGWTDRQHMQCCLRNQPLGPAVSHFSSASADGSCQLAGQLARLCPSFFTNLVGIFQQSQAGLEFYFLWIASCRRLGNALGTLQGPLPWKRRTCFLACGADSHFVHVYMYNGCAHDRCAPSNSQSRGEPTYIRLLSCSSYNSWYNFESPWGSVALINPDTNNWPKFAKLPGEHYTLDVLEEQLITVLKKCEFNSKCWKKTVCWSSGDL